MAQSIPTPELVPTTPLLLFKASDAELPNQYKKLLDKASFLYLST